MQTYSVAARRVDAHGSLAAAKAAEIVLDTDLAGRADAFNPAELLLAEARSLTARMLVMGAFGHTGGLRALLLGTATQRLLRDAPCPVFVSH